MLDGSVDYLDNFLQVLMNVFHVRLDIFIVLTFLLHELGFDRRLILLFIGSHGFLLHDPVSL